MRRQDECFWPGGVLERFENRGSGLAVTGYVFVVLRVMQHGPGTQGFPGVRGRGMKHGTVGMLGYAVDICLGTS